MATMRRARPIKGAALLPRRVPSCDDIGPVTILGPPSREPAAGVFLAIEPVLLAIETAGSACSAAVARGDTVLAAECRALRHGHAEALFPMIERVMQKAGLAPSQLDLVAAALGPGGFTG